MISKLKKEIGTLVIPKELGDKNQDFKITVTAREFKLDQKQIESTILKLAPFKMIATTVGDHVHCVIYDKKKRYEREAHPLTREPKSGPITFHLYVFPQDALHESGWTKYYENVLSGVEIDEFLKEHSGVRIYRDGFWVKPYGGMGNDWLQLNDMRVSRLSNIGNKQVVGFVKISRDKNPEIKDTTTRERLIENDAFRDMRAIVLQAVKEFNVFRKEIKDKGREVEASIPKETMAVNRIDHAKKLIENLELETPMKKEIVKTLRSVKTDIKDYVDTKKNQDIEKDTAFVSQKSLVTIGLATSYIAHEVISPLGDTIKIVASLESRLQNIPSYDTEFSGNMEQLKFNTAKLLHFMAFVHDYSSLISNSIRYKWQSNDVKISEQWKRIISGFKEVVDELSINIEYRESPENIAISINIIDLESMLTNLLTNSIKSLEKIEGPRMIRIESMFLNDSFVLKFSDNGVGVAPENRERIFEPLFSTYDIKSDKARSPGLGLPIVKEILERYDGSIQLTSDSVFQTGASFTISIPLSRAPRVIM